MIGLQPELNRNLHYIYGWLMFSDFPWKARWLHCILIRHSTVESAKSWFMHHLPMPVAVSASRPHQVTATPIPDDRCINKIVGNFFQLIWTPLDQRSTTHHSHSRLCISCASVVYVNIPKCTVENHVLLHRTEKQYLSASSIESVRQKICAALFPCLFAIRTEQHFFVASIEKSNHILFVWEYQNLRRKFIYNFSYSYSWSICESG